MVGTATVLSEKMVGTATVLSEKAGTAPIMSRTPTHVDVPEGLVERLLVELGKVPDAYWMQNLKSMGFGITMHNHSHMFYLGKATYHYPALLSCLLEVADVYAKVDVDFNFSTIHVVRDKVRKRIRNDIGGPALFGSVGAFTGAELQISPGGPFVNTKNKLYQLDALTDPYTRDNLSVRPEHGEHRYEFVFYTFAKVATLMPDDPMILIAKSFGIRPWRKDMYIEYCERKGMRLGHGFDKDKPMTSECHIWVETAELWMEKIGHENPALKASVSEKLEEFTNVYMPKSVRPLRPQERSDQLRVSLDFTTVVLNMIAAYNGPPQAKRPRLDQPEPEPELTVRRNATARLQQLASARTQIRPETDTVIESESLVADATSA